MWKIIAGSIFLLITVGHTIFGLPSQVSDDTLLICDVISSVTLAFGLDEVLRKKKQ